MRGNNLDKKEESDVRTDSVARKDSDCGRTLQSLAGAGFSRKYMEEHLDEIISAMQSPLKEKYPQELLKKILEVGRNIVSSQPSNWKAMWLIALVAWKLGAIDLVDKACKIVLSLNKEFWFARELPKHARGYYSQLGQDEFIERYFSERKPRSKTFVEVGAFDGIHYSNVRRLVEKYGWHGVSIEPVGKNYAKLCQSYLGYDVKCIQAAVSNHTGTAEMNVSTYPHLPEWGSDVASLSTEDNARWTKTYGAKWGKETVEVKTLTDIFSENGLKNVDLLSIDAEGHDVEVLEGLDFSQHKPQLVVVEYRDKREELVRRITAKGYSVIYDTQKTLFFSDIQTAVQGYTTKNFIGQTAEPYDEIQYEIETNFGAYLERDSAEPFLIVIVGAYYGDEIKRLLNRYPNAEIIAFEANPGTYNKLCEKYKAFSNVKCYPYAVSDQNGKMEFYENNLPGTGSILPIDGPSSAGKGQTIDMAKQYGMEQKEKFTVESIRLDDFEPLRSKPIDLLWCDVQGAELHVLKGAQKVLGNCSSLFLEVWFHATLYKEQARLADLEQYLAGQGFYLAGIGLDHKIGNGSGNSFWLSQRLGQRAIDETASYRVREGNTKSPDMTSVSNSSVKKPKIVGLVAARNEENIIGQCLRLLSQFTDAIVYLDDCSTDSSVAVVQSLAEQCRVERIITKDRWLRDEPGDRNKMLQAGREIGGTHFIVLDADEAFTSNFLLNHSLRDQILSLQPGDTLEFNWIALWKSTRQYRYDNSVWTDNYKPFVFCDDGQCSYSSEFIHTPRAPQDLAGRTLKIEGYEYGVLHFQFVNWRNLLLKQAWYRCLEHIREPQKSIVEINKRYAPSKDETNIQLRKANEDWYRYYPDLNAGVFDKEDNWRAEQICGWLKEYGADFFKNLDIWDIITPDVAAVRNAAGGGLYLVSAIVSTYNSEAFIRGCLQDLVEQTLCQKGLLEIVVVNSGSQQNEEAIIREYQLKYPHIQYIKTQERETVYAAWNRGIKAARGKYITNANTDDRHAPEMLEKLALTLEGHPDVGYVYAHFYMTEVANQSWRTKTPRCVSTWQQDYSRDTLLEGYYCGPQPMWRRSLHEEYGYFDERLKVCGDYEFALRISQTHKLMRVPEPLGLYYRSPDSLERSAGTHDQEKEFIINLYKRFGHCVIRRPLSHPLPKFTVIIRNYNKGLYIEEAIQSILAQTLREWELIVVDDASTDNSVDVVRRYLHDPRIKLIRHNRNLGVSQAAITGAANISADLFGDLDSDDILTPDALEQMTKAHLEHPKCGFIYSQHTFCDQNMNPVRPGFCREMPKGQTTLQRDVISAFRTYKIRDYVKTEMHDVELDIAEDKDIFHKMEEVTQFYFVPHSLYLIRELPQSQSRGGDKLLKGWLSWARAKINAHRRRSYKTAVEQKQNPKEAFERCLADVLKQDPFIQLFFRVIHKHKDMLSQELSVPSEPASASEWRVVFWIATESSIKKLLDILEKRQILSDPSWLDTLISLRNIAFNLKKPDGFTMAVLNVRCGNTGENKAAIDLFLEGQRLFASGDMVSARRLIAQYQAQMDYSKLPVIDRRKERNNPLISAIIVTYHRTEDLLKLLDCLSRQTFRDFEIIVVDNGGTDVSRVVDKADRVISCPINFNLSEGRNIGAYFAHGQIAIFLDDDALVDVDYTASIRDAFRIYQVLGLRGKTLPKALSLSNMISICDRGDTPFPTFCNQEGNSAFLLWAWWAVGGQDPLLFGHEGMDLTWRLIQAFGRCDVVMYWPKAVIYHDYGGTAKIRRKRQQYEFNIDYLLYKYGRDITAAKAFVEKLPLPLLSGKCSFVEPSIPLKQQWNSLCYSGYGQKSAAIPGPKVSVIISCLNMAKYLPQCLDSIRAQTLQDWETIIVDDGSTDGTHEILKRYAAMDARFRISLNADNQGPYARRNFAIRQARAPFISIQDADDIMAPHKLEILLDEILEDDRLGIVGSFYGRFLDDFPGREYCDCVRKNVTHEQIMGVFNYTWHTCWHGSAVIRKSLFDQVGLYDNHPWGTDSFWLAKAGLYAQLTGKVRFKNLPELLTFKCEHDASQTGTILPLNPKGRRRMYLRYWEQKLCRIRQLHQADASVDVGRLLRECNCDDFISRFGHLFEQWESGGLDQGMVRGLLDKAVAEFVSGQYVGCLISLHTLCSIHADAGKTIAGLNLLRGLSYFAYGRDAGARRLLEQEYADHRTPQAFRFLQVHLKEENSRLGGLERKTAVDGFVFAYPEIATPGADVVYENRRRSAPAVSIILDCRQQDIDFENLISIWAAQRQADFELIIVTCGNTPSDFASLGHVPVSMAVINTDEPISKAAAKNLAVAQSQGKIIAFVSPLLTAEDTMVRDLVEQMNTQQISAVRGRIVEPDAAPLHLEYDLGTERRYSSVDTDMLCAFRREIIEQNGGFPVGLFGHEMLYLSWKIYSDEKKSCGPILYLPQLQGTIAGNRWTTNYLLELLSKEQLYWHLSTPGGYYIFLCFTESYYRGGDLKTDRPAVAQNIIQFFRRRFPSVALEWARWAYARRPDSAYPCHLLADLEWETGDRHRAVQVYEHFLQSSLVRPITERVLDEQERKVYADVIEFYLQSGLRLAEFYVGQGRRNVAETIVERILSNKNLILNAPRARFIQNLFRSPQPFDTTNAPQMQPKASPHRPVSMSRGVQQPDLATIM